MDTSALPGRLPPRHRSDSHTPEPRERVAQLVRLLLWASITVSGAICIVLFFITPSWPVTAWVNLGLFVLGLALLALLRLGRASEAGIILLTALTVTVAVDSLNPNRSFGLAAPLAPLTIVFAALLFGRRALFLALAGNCLWLLAVTLTKPVLFALPERAMRMQLIDASAYIVYFMCTAVVTLLTSQRIETARAHAAAQSAEIARHARELESEIVRRQQSEDARAQRAREVAWLLDVSNALTSTLDLQPLLDTVLRQLAELVPHDLAVIAAQSKDDPKARVLGVHGNATGIHAGGELDFVESDHELCEHIEAHTPLLFHNMRGADAQTRTMQSWLKRNLRGELPNFAAAMLLPMVARGESRGFILLATTQPGVYSTEIGEFALAFANQCALAIQTSDEQRGRIDLARLNERTKLAHDLHDSVSQSLYGIVLGSHAALGALKEIQNPTPPSGTSHTRLKNLKNFKNFRNLSSAPKLEESLNYVLKQADVGLVEMRALIYELRPEHLLETTLCDAVGRQINALCVRHDITCEAQTRGREPQTPFRIKEAAYRIALQAAANAIQHSKCRVIRMDCSYHEHSTTLVVSDDGQGFDTTQQFDGRFGLKTMRERAAQAGIKLEIMSAPGAGVTVTLTVPAVVET
jgi:signal transduction histidine kinase